MTSTSWWIIAAILAAAASLALSAFALITRRGAPSRAFARGGPYRTQPLDDTLEVDATAKRLGALGSIILSASAVPALAASLATLRWEGIGVTLLAAIGLALARLHTAVAVLRADGVNSARLLARASLLFDLPVAVFALIHIRFVEDGLHDALSLAVVAGAFAVVDGVQAAIVLRLLWTPCSTSASRTCSPSSPFNGPVPSRPLRESSVSRPRR